MTDTPEDVRALAEADDLEAKALVLVYKAKSFARWLRAGNARDVRPDASDYDELATMIEALLATRPSPSASQEPRALLASVEAIPRPGGTYRCGPLADVLCRLMRLSGHEADIVTGSANGIDHVWVEMGGEVYDPTARQFSEAPIYHPVERFTPELFSHPSASQGAEVDRLTDEYIETLARSHAENFVERTDGIWEQKESHDYFVARLTDHFLNFASVLDGTHPDCAAHPAPDTANRAAEDERDRLYEIAWQGRFPFSDEQETIANWLNVQGAMLPADRRAAREATTGERP